MNELEIIALYQKARYWREVARKMRKGVNLNYAIRFHNPDRAIARIMNPYHRIIREHTSPLLLKAQLAAARKNTPNTSYWYIGLDSAYQVLHGSVIVSERTMYLTRKAYRYTRLINGKCSLMGRR